MATLEAKLFQHITGLWQEVLYDFFVDLHNSCYVMHRGRVLVILERFIVSPQVYQLSTRYWYWSTMAARAIVYYRYLFLGYRGITQGVPLAPRIFNVIVDSNYPPLGWDVGR